MSDLKDIPDSWIGALAIVCGTALLFALGYAMHKNEQRRDAAQLNCQQLHGAWRFQACEFK